MTRILFVCIHDAGRSQIADAIVNLLARTLGGSASATPAGTTSAAPLIQDRT